MKTIKRLSDDIATVNNFIEAHENYIDTKPYRTDIREFERHFTANIKTLLRAYNLGNWVPPEYEERVVVEHNKQRRLGVYPAAEHDMEWAALNYLEKPLTDTYIRNSCACVRGRGQNDFIDIISRAMRNDYEGTRYGVQLDAHHYFQLIDHNIIEGVLERKIKDERLMRLLHNILQSFMNGLVLGTKLSQIEANFQLVPFDHGARSLWGVRGDVERMCYWRRRYVDWCIATVRTKEQAEELAKGVQYLNAKFDGLVEKGVFYARFADNIIMLSGDKAFLHIVTEIAIMVLARDYHYQANKSWNVRPVEPDGIDICGYVLHHYFRKVRKRIKQDLWKEIIRLRKKGRSPEEIRLACASRIGWLTHGDCRNLLRRMDVNMEERLGDKIKRRKTTVPFEGMTREQRRSIEDILCHTDEEEKEKMIHLLEYAVGKSIFPGKEHRAALRFRFIKGIVRHSDDTTEYQWNDEECYAWTGSQVLIEQMQKEFLPEDLPAPTAIHEYTNKYGKKYYKFT